MRELLAATTNPGKLKEIQMVFADAGAKLPKDGRPNDNSASVRGVNPRISRAGVGVKLLSLRDFPGVSKAEETGETFEENAVLKAKYYFGKTGVPTLADDGGCMVDALRGLPGVHSHRWLGEHATDLDIARAIVEKLKGVPREKRTA